MAGGWSSGTGCEMSMLLVRRSRSARTNAVFAFAPWAAGCAGSGSVLVAAVWASMCLAGSNATLRVTPPTCTCAGETSIVAGGSDATALEPAAIGVPDAEMAGDGLAIGLALTPGAVDGAAALGAVTHPAASTRAASGPPPQRAVRLRRAAFARRNPGIDLFPRIVRRYVCRFG